ncbi:MAG: restriction endonuclease subunit S [Bacilli bacterium]
MGKWENIRIGDITKTNLSVYSIKENWDYVNYLDTGNITMNRITEIQKIMLKDDKLPSRARRKVNMNNIIYSTVRPNQLHYGIIKKQPVNFLVSTGFTVVDVDEKKANPNFIYYFLSHPDTTAYLQAIGEQSTSAYPSIKPSDIENMKIMLPEKVVQDKIVGILLSLDEKIDLNNKINNNLVT